jgi:hypothetical protein
MFSNAERVRHLPKSCPKAQVSACRILAALGQILITLGQIPKLPKFVAIQLCTSVCNVHLTLPLATVMGLKLLEAG